MAARLMAETWVRSATHPAMTRSQRNTIFLEDARVADQPRLPGHQYVLRLERRRRSPRIAGSFVHLQCAADIPMRRPLSILGLIPKGWIEVLFKVVATVLRSLAAVEPGDRISSLGPSAKGSRRPGPDAHCSDRRWRRNPTASVSRRAPGGRSRTTLAPIAPPHRLEIPFPFKPARSRIPVLGIATGGCLRAVLEKLGVPSRLASLAGFDGCYQGYVTALAGEGSQASARTTAGSDDLRLRPRPCSSSAGLPVTSAIPAQVCLENTWPARGRLRRITVEIVTDTGRR